MIHNLKSEVRNIKEIAKPQKGSKHSFISIKKKQDLKAAASVPANI